MEAHKTRKGDETSDKQEEKNKQKIESSKGAVFYENLQKDAFPTNPIGRPQAITLSPVTAGKTTPPLDEGGRTQKAQKPAVLGKVRHIPGTWIPTLPPSVLAA